MGRFLLAVAILASPAAAFVPPGREGARALQLPPRGARAPALQPPQQGAGRALRSQTRHAAAARELDTDALVKYGSAVGIQMAGLTAFLGALDQVRRFLPWLRSRGATFHWLSRVAVIPGQQRLHRRWFDRVQSGARRGMPPHHLASLGSLPFTWWWFAPGTWMLGG